MKLLDETESHRNYFLPRWTFAVLTLLVISSVLLLLPAVPDHLELSHFIATPSLEVLVMERIDCSPDEILRSIKPDRVVDTFDYTLSHDEAMASLRAKAEVETSPCRGKIFASSEAIHLVSVLVRPTCSARDTAYKSRRSMYLKCRRC